jgi:hypothetical protein
MKFSFPPTDGSMGGDLQRLIVHLEHVAETAALLRAGGVVRERMALVAADHLAEVLLQDHMERAFLETEELGPLSPRRYDRDQRQRLLADFSARVQLACTAPDGVEFRQPILDARDANIFRVAHAYRNALYHGDRHNPALGRSLAVEYLQAVARTLVRSWPMGLTYGISARDGRLRAFRRLGAPSAQSVFEPRRVAEECVRHLVGRFRVQRATLCRQLVRDLEERARAVQAVLDDIGRRGLSHETQRDLIRAALLWAAHRADPELIRLEHQRADILRGAAGRSDYPTDAEIEAYAATESAIEQRRQALSQPFRAPVTIATVRRMPRSVRKLILATDTATLLDRYQTLDERLRLLEQAVTAVDLDLERMVQRETDLARGK